MWDGYGGKWNIWTAGRINWKVSRITSLANPTYERTRKSMGGQVELAALDVGIVRQRRFAFSFASNALVTSGNTVV